MNEARVRRRLEEERQRLEALRHTMLLESLNETQQASTQELSSLDQHPGDQGTETFEREKAESIRISTETQLADVERALGRLNAGEYGICEMCGKKISDERLEARPAARYCVQDQARAEAQNAGLL